MTNADVILEQLGGQRFKVMTGARDFYYSNGGRTLQFKLSARLTSNKANFVTVTLDDNDEYTVTFIKYRQLEMRTVSEHDSVPASNLRELFKGQTGLDVSL